MKLLIGSTNKGKFIDMSAAFAGLDLDLLQPSDLGITEVPEETGSTFLENARAKARFYFERSELPTLADDSGIIVDALKDELGVFTRRWGAGPDVSDQEWVDYFLNTMKLKPNKSARFECALCYIDGDGNEYYFDGICDGVITETLESNYLPGLPIAACFKPDGCTQVYAAMGVEGKNEWSHRGRAMRKFIEFLDKNQP